MKRIFLSLAVIAVVAVASVSATRAYFSDTETITGNTFTASTMDLQIDSNPSSSAYTWGPGFTGQPFMGLQPGYEKEQIIDIMNVGGVDGNATIDLSRTSAWSDLAGVLNFHVYYDGNHDGVFDETGLNGTVDQYNQVYTLGLIAGNPADSQPGKVASVKIVWTVPASAGNAIQGDSVTVDAMFGVEQVH